MYISQKPIILSHFLDISHFQSTHVFRKKAITELLGSLTGSATYNFGKEPMKHSHANKKYFEFNPSPDFG